MVPRSWCHCALGQLRPVLVLMKMRDAQMWTTLKGANMIVFPNRTEQNNLLLDNTSFFSRCPAAFWESEGHSGDYVSGSLASEGTSVICPPENAQSMLEDLNHRARHNERYEILYDLSFLKGNPLVFPCSKCNKDHDLLTKFLVVATSESYEKHGLRFFISTPNEMRARTGELRSDVMEMLEKKEWIMIVPLDEKQVQNAIRICEEERAERRNDGVFLVTYQDD